LFQAPLSLEQSPLLAIDTNGELDRGDAVHYLFNE